MLALFLRFVMLVHVTHAPSEHVHAALHAETAEIRASLLLAQSWKESRWTIHAVSRVELQRDGSRARRGGTWRGKFPPHFRGPYFCGPSQVKRLSERACKTVGLDLKASYLEARLHIEQWLDYCKRTGSGRSLDCALAGYGGGVRFAKKTASKSRPWRYGQHTQRMGKAYEERIKRILENPHSSPI